MGGAGVDARFEANYAGATANGVASAFYHLFRTDSDPVTQARHLIRTVEGGEETRFGEFYAVDVERVAGQPTLTQAEYASRLRAFLEYLKQETSTPIWIYTSPGEWAALVGNEQSAWFAQFGLWNAAYTTAPEPLLPTPWKGAGYKLWQFTSSGSVKGISGRVDMNKVPAKTQSERRFIIPVDFPYVMSSGFNAPRSYTFAPNRKQLHEGADFAPTSAAVAPYRVIAPAAGKVDKIGFDARGYGNYVRIVHEDGFVSWLAHLKEPSTLKVGAQLEMGDTVGYAGSTGATSTGTHCHWTLQHIGQGASNYVVADVVNPLEYVLS